MLCLHYSYASCAVTVRNPIKNEIPPDLALGAQEILLQTFLETPQSQEISLQTFLQFLCDVPPHGGIGWEISLQTFLLIFYDIPYSLFPGIPGPLGAPECTETLNFIRFPARKRVQTFPGALRAPGSGRGEFFCTRSSNFSKTFLRITDNASAPGNSSADVPSFSLTRSSELLDPLRFFLQTFLLMIPHFLWDSLLYFAIPLLCLCYCFVIPMLVLCYFYATPAHFYAIPMHSNAMSMLFLHYFYAIYTLFLCDSYAMSLLFLCNSMLLLYIFHAIQLNCYAIHKLFLCMSVPSLCYFYADHSHAFQCYY